MARRFTWSADLMSAEAANRRKIKWGYATHCLTDTPSTAGELDGRIAQSDDPPNPNDVIVAEITWIGQHTRVETSDGGRSTLFPGDLVGVAYGHRYATRQWRGTIPNGPEPCHILSVAGVCGEVLDMIDDMEEPTELRPLGYLVGGQSRRVDLEDHGLAARDDSPPTATVILVVGSSMDSGKTTAAAMTVHGLTLTGARVCAGKITGTASRKDIQLMADAGAVKVLDFTDAGYASTAFCSPDQLAHCATGIISHLSEPEPDYIVLEIADGIIQRETEMLLQLFQRNRFIDYTLYTCIDNVGLMAGVHRLYEYGINVVAVSGLVACSPLAAQETKPYSDLPVLQMDELCHPDIVKLFPKRSDKPGSRIVAMAGSHGSLSAGLSG